MKVIREIDVFDNQTELLVREIPLENFDLETFKKRFEVREKDPLMYGHYEITPSTTDLFPTIVFDFSRYSYYVACFQD